MSFHRKFLISGEVSLRFLFRSLQSLSCVGGLILMLSRAVFIRVMLSVALFLCLILFADLALRISFVADDCVREIRCAPLGMFGRGGGYGWDWVWVSLGTLCGKGVGFFVALDARVAFEPFEGGWVSSVSQGAHC